MKMKYLIITISTIFLANCASTSLELPKSYTEESKKEDIDFCKQALQAIKDGKQVIYTCWW